MDIKSSLPLLQALRTGAGAPAATPPALNPTAPQTAVAPADSFANLLGSALDKVSATQTAASQLQTDYQYGKPEATLERTMVAMQSAQLQFQAAVTVRNRLVSAYTDIMNMPV